MNSECQYATEAAAYVSDELSAGEIEAYQLHLVTCATCRAAVESSRQLIGRLKTVPRIEVSRDLTPLILEKLREPERELSRTPRWQQVGAIAAAITFVAGGAALWRENPATIPLSA